MTASAPDLEIGIDQTPQLLIDTIKDAHPCSDDQDATQTHLWSVLFDVPNGINTYAVLDGAIITHLPEILANSRMAHQSLFQGKARDELSENGPWIVALDGTNDLSKGLITDANVLTAFWPKAGFFLHSAEDLGTVVKHLRHFTRIKDTSGKWFFFRFWETDFVTAYLMAMTGTQRQAFFGNGMVNAFITLGDTCQRLSLDNTSSGPPAPLQITLSAEIFRALSHVTEARFRRDMITHLTQDHQLGKEQAAALYQAVLGIPLRSREAIGMVIDCVAPLPAGLTDTRVVKALDESEGAPDLVRAMRLKNELSKDVSS